MFRIRHIYDDFLPIDAEAIRQVQGILRSQLPGLSQDYVDRLPDQLIDPVKYRLRSILFVADNERGTIRGFALLQHAVDLNFCYLDFISAAARQTGGGIGGALYQRIREEAYRLGANGLFFECLPDDPVLCPDSAERQQNIARLSFYEKFGARPLANTAYETPVNAGDLSPPYLVFDDLGRNEKLGRDRARAVVQTILERKYGDVCPLEYVNRVLDSITDDPVQIRAPRYLSKAPTVYPIGDRQGEARIALVVNEKHDIHHVRDRGYVEAPVRIRSILNDLLHSGLFDERPAKRFPDKHIKAVHDHKYLSYLKKVCQNVPPKKSVYPYVFPIRNAARPPRELPLRAGYYCIDTFTPLNENAYLAARAAVDCTLTAGKSLLQGHRLAYALVRPPGHHAERRAFGGFCYLNSTAIAANYLSDYGRVAILDIDYHHGNGQQDIFYHRSDVLTLSIHGHPRFAYPYFSGFRNETGEGEGKGNNVNLPQPEQLSGDEYLKALEQALKRIVKFEPSFLVVALGLDTASGDPTGSWSLKTGDFERNGFKIGALGYRTLVVQEGGYRIRSLGSNARHFFDGLWQGSDRPPAPAKRRR